MVAYSTLYAPTTDPADCEHFFPCAEELGYDPDAWTGPDPADCTGCGISYDQYQAEAREADDSDPVLWEG
jgi:hypothetical protein